MHDRDLVGYGPSPPRVRWPNDARVAISLVVNYEEGSENLLQDGIGKRELMGEVAKALAARDWARLPRPPSVG